MTELVIIEDCEFFTAGINHVQNGFIPFFQNHEVEDDFEEEEPLVSEELALLRLAEIVIEKLDEACAPNEDLETCDGFEDDASDGDSSDCDEADGCDEPEFDTIGYRTEIYYEYPDGTAIEQRL